jgi:predicted GNAT family acetyltransferase
MSFEVRNAPDASRYELWEDDTLVGIADYRPGPDGALVFPHTEIRSDRRGEGLGEVLVRGALDDVRERGDTIVPACWFVADFVEANEDYRDLLAA